MMLSGVHTSTIHGKFREKINFLSLRHALLNLSNAVTKETYLIYLSILKKENTPHKKGNQTKLGTSTTTQEPSWLESTSSAAPWLDYQSTIKAVTHVRQQTRCSTQQIYLRVRPGTGVKGLVNSWILGTHCSGMMVSHTSKLIFCT